MTLPLTRIKLSRQLPIILSNTELISTSVANKPYFLANSKRKLSLRTKSLPEPIGPKCKRVFGTSSTLSAPMGCETSMTSLLPMFMKSLSVLAAGRLKSLSVFCINILRPSLSRSTCDVILTKATTTSKIATSSTTMNAISPKKSNKS
uniref:Uncharacterized protein n=1 Tax=Glossina pallidipes TaxID=7398 RepID=A0A1B0A3E9_GLOPL